mgnify:FL=1
MDSEQELKDKKLTIALQKKQWRQENPHKSRIANWKNQQKLVSSPGVPLTNEEWMKIHDKWNSTKTCDCCGNTFNSTTNRGFNDKQLDHCHKTRMFRNILCARCNKIRAYVDKDYQTIMKLMSM